MADVESLAKAAQVVTIKGIGDFKRQLRAQARLFWNSDRDRDEFAIGVQNTIDRFYRQAYRQGAAECGVRPSQYTTTMEAHLQDMINGQFPHVLNLASQVVSKEEGGLLRDIHNRLELWVARYEEVVNAAKVTACEHRPLKWVLGVAEHCPSCLSLAGIVKPASFWRDSGVLPRQAGATYLACRGYNCQCRLRRTNEEITPGPLPALP